MSNEPSPPTPVVSNGVEAAHSVPARDPDAASETATEAAVAPAFVRAAPRRPPNDMLLELMNRADILRLVLSYLDEVSLYVLQQMYPDPVRELSLPQWDILARLDQEKWSSTESLSSGPRWQHPVWFRAACDWTSMIKSPSRESGGDFARQVLLVQKLEKEVAPRLRQLTTGATTTGAKVPNHWSASKKRNGDKGGHDERKTGGAAAAASAAPAADRVETVEDRKTISVAKRMRGLFNRPPHRTKKGEEKQQSLSIKEFREAENGLCKTGFDINPICRPMWNEKWNYSFPYVPITCGAQKQIFVRITLVFQDGTERHWQGFQFYEVDKYPYILGRKECEYTYERSVTIPIRNPQQSREALQHMYASFLIDDGYIMATGGCTEVDTTVARNYLRTMLAHTRKSRKTLIELRSAQMDEARRCSFGTFATQSGPIACYGRDQGRCDGGENYNGNDAAAAAAATPEDNVEWSTKFDQFCISIFHPRPKEALGLETPIMSRNVKRPPNTSEKRWDALQVFVVTASNYQRFYIQPGPSFYRTRLLSSLGG